MSVISKRLQSALTIERRTQLYGACNVNVLIQGRPYRPGPMSYIEALQTLLCLARPHGTVSPSNCVLHHCLSRRLQKNSKLIYSGDSTYEDLFNWRYIHSF